MPSFPKPKFTYNYQAAAQITALRNYRDTKPGRQVPAKQADRLLVATWNIANLGEQERRPQDYQLLAEMITWFDIVAIQEVKDDLSGLRALQQELPANYRFLFSDHAGNKERLTFCYDADKVSLLEKVGEVAIPPSDLRYIKLPGVEITFDGFDRTPYLAAFQAGSFNFLLVNVHLYFGKEKEQASIDRRSLEAFAVARWADLRRKSKNAYTTDVIVLGDFNLPKIEEDDPIYKVLKQRGLFLPGHSTEVGSNLDSDKHYDQIAFFPGETSDEFTGAAGVFDFDGAVFATLWDNPERTDADFKAYVRYYLSDHRIFWSEFKTNE